MRVGCEREALVEEIIGSEVSGESDDIEWRRVGKLGFEGESEADKWKKKEEEKEKERK